MNYKFPLASSTWGPEEIAAIEKVTNSGFFVMGSNVAAFEELFAEYMGSTYCVMVNSGSSANLLMVAALFHTQQKSIRIKDGDEVIVPAVSWGTTFFPLHQYGLKLRFVDIDLDTLNFDIQQLADTINDRTRLILAVNILGNPNEFDTINELIAGRNIVLLEDNCESLGATYQGKKAGTFGVMGSFSTYFSHHISTMEGGLITTDNEELYHTLLSLRAHGWTRDLPKTNRLIGQKSDNYFDESFRFLLPGYNLRPLEFAGATGIEQVKKLPNFIATRRANGKLWQETMSEHPDILIQKEIGESSWFGFSLVIRPSSKLKRSELIKKVAKLGFEYRPVVSGNFTNSEVIKYFDFEIPFSLTNAKTIDRNGLFVGNQSYPIPDAIEALGEL